MRKRNKKLKEVKYIEDVLCNKCGDSLKVLWDKNNKEEFEFYGLMTTVSGGYNSTHLQDAVTYNFDLCEKCLVEYFKTFKIQPDSDKPY